MAQKTAGGFVVNLGCTSEVSTVLCRGCQLSVGPGGCIFIALELWDPTISHGFFYTPSACPACLSMSFEIFPQEILNSLHFCEFQDFYAPCWCVVSFLLQVTFSSTFHESLPPLSASVLSLKEFQIFLLFLRTSKDKSVYQHLKVYFSIFVIF